MKHDNQNKRFTVLGVTTIALLALLGLTAMGIVLHRQDIKNNWRSDNIITLEGKLACLPPKNADQPHTLECAAGLKVGDAFYALSYHDTDTQRPTSGDVTVTGVYMAPAASGRYDTVGTLDVVSVKQK
ncbi:MAG TPA: hypothetical protein VFZ58_02890 [Candidatus Saccharimonadales bacterium]